jgi:hypothetical protein
VLGWSFRSVLQEKRFVNEISGEERALFKKRSQTPEESTLPLPRQGKPPDSVIEKCWRQMDINS